MVLIALTTISAVVIVFLMVYAKAITSILDESKSTCHDVDTVVCFHCVAVVIIMLTYFFIMAGTLTASIDNRLEELQFEYGVHASQIEARADGDS